MKISSAFPSKYLRAADLEDGTVVLTIDRVEMENPGGPNSPDDERPVMYFKETKKGLVLNRVNSNTVSDAYTDETDAWKGQLIGIHADETEFRGRMVPCIRLTTRNLDKQPAANPGDIPF